MRSASVAAIVAMPAGTWGEWVFGSLTLVALIWALVESVLNRRDAAIARQQADRALHNAARPTFTIETEDMNLADGELELLVRYVSGDAAITRMVLHAIPDTANNAWLPSFSEGRKREIRLDPPFEAGEHLRTSAVANLSGTETVVIAIDAYAGDSKSWRSSHHVTVPAAWANIFIDLGDL